MTCRCGETPLSTAPRISSPEIRPTSSRTTLRDRWVTLITRLGIRRSHQSVEPGLYALGRPDANTPVFVTANYSPSFRSVRSALKGRDAYLLVLDTRGINVWCAAGGHLFGTDELVRRIESVGLPDIVRHRILVLPQLGAPGVAAHEVKDRTGFTVRWGPVLASDLPRFLETGKATEEMRRVRFPLRSRLAAVPAEAVNTLILSALLGIPLFLAGGTLAGLAGVVAVLSGTLLFPVLLPWLPTHNFATKGFLLGLLAALPFAVWSVSGGPGIPLWQKTGWAVACLFMMPPVTAFLALNYTGSTTSTSWSGVKREIHTYVPLMAWLFLPGALLAAVLGIFRALGGWA